LLVRSGVLRNEIAEILIEGGGKKKQALKRRKKKKKKKKKKSLNFPKTSGGKGENDRR